VNVKLSRRVWFFLGVMVVCLAMIVPTPSEFWPLNLFMAGLSLFWAVLLGIEDVLGRREPTPPSSWTEPMIGDGDEDGTGPEAG
jgi:hypothetical protein